MSEMQVASGLAYKPPQRYLDQHNDPTFFNYQYQQYTEHLKSGEEKGYGAPIKSQSIMKTEEDREENTGLYNKQESNDSLP